MNAVIRFDGGCRGNPGHKYGSYEVRLDDKVIARDSRFELGFGTNNEAEWESLLRGISALRNYLLNAGIYKAGVDVTIFTDSMIVVYRLTKKNRIHKAPSRLSRSEVMYNFAVEVKDLLAPFKSFTVTWEGRDSNVAVFGH